MSDTTLNGQSSSQQSIWEGIIKKLSGELMYQLFEAWAWPLWWRNDGRVSGEIPEESFVMVANHGSYLDWIILEILFRRKFHRDLTFLAKKKVFTNPFFRLGAANRKIIIAETPVTSAVLTRCVESLQRKDRGNPILCLFPEGTRIRTGQRHRVHNGAAWISRTTGVPIVPTALCGFWEVWPPNRPVPTVRRMGMTIRFLAPMRAEQFETDKEFMDAAMNEVYMAVHRDSRRMK